MQGFFRWEGCFFIEIKPRGNYVNLRVFIGQHFRDKILISSFLSILNCRSIKNSNNFTTFSINNFKDIYNKVIPFFNKYKIEEGVKLFDFEDFCKAVELVNKKIHLTSDGFNRIKTIKSGMNKARYNI